MGNELSTKLEGMDQKTLLSLITNGDCSKLSDEQKIAYYVSRCEMAGLDPRSNPLQYINLGGKLVLYALKAATDQLSSNRKISVQIVSQETAGETRVVTARASTADGRYVDEVGCLHIGKLGGENLANALMKTVTKAKRRAIISFCGLGLLDETEVESLTPEARKAKKEEEKKLSNDGIRNRLDTAIDYFTTVQPLPPINDDELKADAKRIEEEVKRQSQPNALPF